MTTEEKAVDYQQKISDIRNRLAALDGFDRRIIGEGGPHTAANCLIHHYCSGLKTVLTDELKIYQEAIEEARNTPGLTVEQDLEEKYQQHPQFKPWESPDIRNLLLRGLGDFVDEQIDGALYNISPRFYNGRWSGL